MLDVALNPQYLTILETPECNLCGLYTIPVFDRAWGAPGFPTPCKLNFPPSSFTDSVIYFHTD